MPQDQAAGEIKGIGRPVPLGVQAGVFRHHDRVFRINQRNRKKPARRPDLRYLFNRSPHIVGLAPPPGNYPP